MNIPFVRQRLKTLGSILVAPESQEYLQKFVEIDIDKCARVIKRRDKVDAASGFPFADLPKVDFCFVTDNNLSDRQPRYCLFLVLHRVIDTKMREELGLQVALSD